MNPLTQSRPKGVFSSLLEIGTDGISDMEEKSRIIMVNTISYAVTISILGIGSLIVLYSGVLHLLIPLSLDFLFNFSVPFLNHKRKHDAARLVVYYTQCGALAYFGFTLSALLQLEYAIVLLIAINYLIFKGKHTRFIGLIAAILVLGLIEYAHYKYPFGPVLGLSFDQAYIIHTLVVLAIIIITVLVSTHYIRRNDLSYVLERNNKLIKLFVAQITHEVRTPLNAIHQIIQMLRRERRKALDTKSQESFLDMALAESKITKNIINNVLDLAQIEAGKMENSQLETFQTKTYFEKFVDLNNVIAHTEDMRIELSIEDMPPAIKFDPLCLQQILMNLLANAIKYGDSGSTIHVVVKKAGQDNWILQVSNRGNTIPEERIATIFDPFITIKDVYTEGTGLGLYIVAHKVQLMKGTIAVESLSRKTTFTATFPLTVGALSNVVSEFNAWDAENVDLQGVHVLLADDHKLSALFLFYHLTEMGCKVIMVHNGLELIREAEKNAPDIIIMDCHMPEMNGVDATRWLKKHEVLRLIPIIVSSGDLFSDTIEKTLQAGADAFIEKPIDIKPLLATIRRELAKRKKSL